MSNARIEGSLRPRTTSRPAYGLALALAGLASCGERAHEPGRDAALAQGLDSIDECRFESSYPAFITVHPARLIVADTTLSVSDWPARMNLRYVNEWLAADEERGRRALTIRQSSQATIERPLPDYVPDPLAFGPGFGVSPTVLLHSDGRMLYLAWRGNEIVELSSAAPGGARRLADLGVSPGEVAGGHMSAAWVGDEVAIVAPLRDGYRAFVGRVENGRIVVDPTRQRDWSCRIAFVFPSASRFHVFRTRSLGRHDALETMSREPAGSDWSTPIELSTTCSVPRKVTFTSNGSQLYVAWLDGRLEEFAWTQYDNKTIPFVGRSDNDGRSWKAGVCVMDAYDLENHHESRDLRDGPLATGLWNDRLVLFFGSRNVWGDDLTKSVRVRVLSPDLTRMHDLTIAGEAVGAAFRKRMLAAVVR